jgi:pilus assembly protein CpaF
MLDGRGMNPTTMIRRITEHVTHIGLEMRMIGGVRKLVRIGEYEWLDGEIKLRELVRYEEASAQWLFPDSFSDGAMEKIRRIDPEGYRKVMETERQSLC